MHLHRFSVFPEIYSGFVSHFITDADPTAYLRLCLMRFMIISIFEKNIFVINTLCHLVFRLSVVLQKLVTF